MDLSKTIPMTDEDSDIEMMFRGKRNKLSGKVLINDCGKLFIVNKDDIIRCENKKKEHKRFAVISAVNAVLVSVVLIVSDPFFTIGFFGLWMIAISIPQIVRMEK